MAGINFTDEQEYAPKLSFKNNGVLADVSGSVCIKCKVKVSAVPHPSKLCYECWKENKADR